jgi:hypothetical protein
MLAPTKPRAVFRGGVLSMIRPAFFLTHPHRAFMDRFMPLLSPSNQASASHRSV